MTDHAAVPFHLLPPLLRKIVDAIGLQDTMRLVEKFGGVRIYIPTEHYCTAHHEIAQTIGLDKLQALSRVLSPTSKQVVRFQLPKADRALKAVRNGMMIRDSLHMSNRDIAIKYRLTEDGVRRILNTPEPEPPPQQPLF